jgi:peptidoglycan hydrolase CwlO-like protein
VRNRIKTLLLILTVAILACFAWKEIKADDSITSLTTEQQKEQKAIKQKIKDLEEKAQTYQQIINIKQKQQLSLNNQVSIIEAEIERIKTEIEINKDKIGELNSQISDLRTKIDEKESVIAKQKIVLSQLLQKYYEYKSGSVYSALISANGSSSFTSEEDQLSIIGEKVREMIENINSLKRSLESEKANAEDNKNKITQLYLELEEKNSELNGNIAEKESLISQTKGEELRYQQLLSRVESQKQELLGDINELYSANSAEISSLSASLPKPTSGLASTSWYYSQKDERWGNNRIGQSSSLIKDYGCALTSVAMIFTYYGETTTPGTLAKQKIYYWDLIVWPDGNNVKLVEKTSHGSISWSRIDRELGNGHPVIVFIKARGSAGHYVVIHHKVGSDYVVHDPYFGANIYLSSSIKLLSKLYGTSISKSSIDQMILYGK